jgi:hypothetical protein
MAVVWRLGDEPHPVAANLDSGELRVAVEVARSYATSIKANHSGHPVDWISLDFRSADPVANHTQSAGRTMPPRR